MSWQTPGKDGPDPNDPGVTTPAIPHAAPEPDAETTRVPVTPGADDPVPPPPPTAGLISAKPVGWTDPNAGPAQRARDG